MTRVLLDACVPQWLRLELKAGLIETARFAGLDDIPDKELLDRISGRYDALVTLDRNLPYQQNLTTLSFAVVLMRVSDQTPASFRRLLPELNEAVENCMPGDVIIVGT